MQVKVVKQLLQNNQSDIAFVVGNGINRHNSTKSNTSWDALLEKLWEEVSGVSNFPIPKSGISFTEFYDILDLKRDRTNCEINLQKRFCYLMKNWTCVAHHKQFIDYAITIKAPVLTTNFENILGDAGDLRLFRTTKEHFTDFYPWQSYYGKELLGYPTDGFGIWHINGMQKYHRSIRLGLSHYMGSVEKARRLIHNGIEDKSFTGKNVSGWNGAKSWLHIVFNKSLFIFGLGLDENEVFLRWLLIERAKYFAKFPERKYPAWYLSKTNSNNIGKEFFLEQLGVECIELSEYADIYENIWQ